MSEQAEMRELLELAALAVGIKVRCFDNIETLILEVDELIYWNPHTDDGDSRRLQVALGIELWPNHNGSRWVAAVFEIGEPDEEIIQFGEPVGQDSPAAARLAVLKVAAEIGRRMKCLRAGARKGRNAA